MISFALTLSSARRNTVPGTWLTVVGVERVERAARSGSAARLLDPGAGADRAGNARQVHDGRGRDARPLPIPGGRIDRISEGFPGDVSDGSDAMGGIAKECVCDVFLCFFSSLPPPCTQSLTARSEGQQCPVGVERSDRAGIGAEHHTEHAGERRR